MAIAKKPVGKQEVVVQDEEKAATFIKRAGKQGEPKEDTKRKPFLIRFAPDVLERVDTAARRRGISRSAWIQFTVSRALDQGEG